MTTYIWTDYKGNCIFLQDQNETIIFAHRGMIEKYPENSFESIVNSFDHGIISEFDLRLTKDNHIVIFHDSNLKHLTGIDKNIKDLYLHDIEDKIKISDGITEQAFIPTFKKVLDAICNVDIYNVDRLFLDLKTDFPPSFERDDKLINIMFENLIESKCKNISINYVMSSSNPMILNSIKHLFYSKYEKQLNGTMTTLWILGNSGYSFIDVFIYLLLKSRLWFYLFIDSPPNAVGFFYEFYAQHNDLMNNFRDNFGICTAFGINYLKSWKHGKKALDALGKIKGDNITANFIIDHFEKDVWTKIIKNRYSNDPYVTYFGNNVEMLFILILTVSSTYLIHSLLQFV